MKKKATVDLVEQSEKVSFYSISFQMDRGALERYFRPEGTMEDNLCALPIESGNIRLYCLRISDEILILGNGDRKTTRTYQEERKLLGYALDLQKFDILLKKDIEDGVVTVEERTLKYIENNEYLL